ncbi:MAG: hypothetical protein AB2745_03195 [Candidatus Thiodiazotropha endolucinida]
MASSIGLSDLTKDRSETIGFVVACLFSSAIDVSELNQWASTVIEGLDVQDIPDYIFELVEFNGPLAGVYKTIGFSPVWNRFDEEDAALYGIAVKRGREVFDMPVSPASALKSLDDHPHIKDAFNLVFPFAAI